MAEVAELEIPVGMHRGCKDQSVFQLNVTVANVQSMQRFQCVRNVSAEIKLLMDRHWPCCFQKMPEIT